MSHYSHPSEEKMHLLCPQSYCTHSYWPYVRAGTQNNLYTGCFHRLTQVWLQQTGTAATKHQKTRAFHFEMVSLIPAASYLTTNHTNINLWLSFNNVNNKATLSKITKQKMWSWDHLRHPPPLYPGSYSVFYFDSRLSSVCYQFYVLSFTLISCVLLPWSVQSPQLVLSMSVHIFVLCLVSIYLYCMCKTAFLDFPVCLYSWILLFSRGLLYLIGFQFSQSAWDSCIWIYFLPTCDGPLALFRNDAH